MQITDLYQTKIECSTYNANIDSTNNVITVSLIDFNGAAVTGKSVTLTCDMGYFNKNGSTAISGTSTKSITGTTDSEGKITATWTASEWGLCTFSANNIQSQVHVTGLKQINQQKSTNITYTVYVDESKRKCQLTATGSSFSIASGQSNYQLSNVIPSTYRPKTNLFSFISRNQYLFCYVWVNGTVGLTNWRGSTETNQECNALIEWTY